MSMPGGLLGFPSHTRFALIQTGTENYFFWLQSVDDPNLAFVVTDPIIFFKDYDVPVREETQQELQLKDPAFLQIFVICNKVGEWLTGNLLGPIVDQCREPARPAGRPDREEVDDAPASAAASIGPSRWPSRPEETPEDRRRERFAFEAVGRQGSVRRVISCLRCQSR